MLVLGGCKHATPDNVAATVNGRTITFADLDKQYQTQFMSSTERPSDDQMMIQKLEVLRTLVDNEIMLQRAEKLGLMATDADVESKLTERAKRAAAENRVGCSKNFTSIPLFK